MPQRITGHTELIGLIATPIRHSKSPMMHNTAFEALGLDYAYLAFDFQPDRLEDAIDALPLMADKKCILVRDIDPTADPERICALPGRVADGCVLIFYQMTLQPDRKKAWQELIRSVDAAGSVVRFDRHGC